MVLVFFRCSIMLRKYGSSAYPFFISSTVAVSVVSMLAPHSTVAEKIKPSAVLVCLWIISGVVSVSRISSGVSSPICFSHSFVVSSVLSRPNISKRAIGSSLIYHLLVFFCIWVIVTTRPPQRLCLMFLLCIEF